MQPTVLQPEERHVPVLLNRCVSLLSPALQKPGSVYVDGTLGMGGHAVEMLRANPQAALIGFDRDTQAIAMATQRLTEKSVMDRSTLVHAVFDLLAAELKALNVQGVDAMLLDLGVSSLQLDESDRGFAYAMDAPLDMRMDPESGEPTAADILNMYSVEDLARIISRYGEERFARRIAGAIVRARATRKLETSAQLVDILRIAVPQASQRTGGHPAKRTFQALRIEVNRELAVLESVLPQALNALNPGGRLVVLSYHSLEDRLVKRVFAEASASKAPAGLPVELPEHKAEYALLVRGSEKASDQEIELNPRSQSVRLRAIERVTGRATLEEPWQ